MVMNLNPPYSVFIYPYPHTLNNSKRIFLAINSIIKLPNFFFFYGNNIAWKQAGTKIGPNQLGPPVRVGSTRIDSDCLESWKKKHKIKWNWNFYPFEGYNSHQKWARLRKNCEVVPCSQAAILYCKCQFL